MDRSTSPRLRPGLVRDLERANPWWRGQPQRPLPSTRRHLVAQIHRRLEARLAPIVVVRGPRQVGKTTAVRHVVQDLLDRGVPPRQVFAVQLDELPEIRVREPILRFVDWYESEVLGKTLNQLAHDGGESYLVFDEVQGLRDWAPQLKYLVDHAATRVIVTGSSALRIEAGRDSLAGRITTIETGVLSLTEIAQFRGRDLGSPELADNGLDVLQTKAFWTTLKDRGRRLAAERDEAFAWFCECGGYLGQCENGSLRELLPVDPTAPAEPPEQTLEEGRLAESVVGATLSSVPGLEVAHSPERSGEPEIDFVLSVGSVRIPLEVKYQRRIDPLRDTEGLRTFIERTVNRAPFGLLVTQVDDDVVVDPRIVALPLSTLLLLR